MPRIHIVTVTRSPTPALHPRVPQTTTTTTTTSDRPFFPEPSTLTPPQKDDDQANTRNSLTKTVLEYTLLAVAIVIFSCLVIRRLSRLKRTNQPIRNFFSWSGTSGPTSTPQPTFPRTTGLPSLRNLPFYPSAAYDPHNRRIRGQDTDTRGRRLGSPGGEYDYDHDDKDLLPAYDTAGGPPKYIDVELDFLGRNQGGGGRLAGLGAGVGAGGRRPSEGPGSGLGRRDDIISPPSTQVPVSPISIGSSLPFRMLTRATSPTNPGPRAASTTSPVVPEECTPSMTTSTAPPPPRVGD
ncbi:hypothetical protein BDZ94DRAFT_1304665 [Collybia nuda]|uniref:Uncharacterized protein n=1 Tax=Collybia nuda TaxID=64659 RepID=A0A9P5YID2_9AGAR|nr:hypothetical protein BDZ94DRAFT_1304665 [Collybia nuda]